MATPWIKDGKVVIDSAGKVILCNDCPCVGTGTGTGTGGCGCSIPANLTASLEPWNTGNPGQQPCQGVSGMTAALTHEYTSPAGDCARWKGTFTDLGDFELVCYSTAPCFSGSECGSCSPQQCSGFSICGWFPSLPIVDFCVSPQTGQARPSCCRACVCDPFDVTVGVYRVPGNSALCNTLGCDISGICLTSYDYTFVVRITE